jgi:hypothetical protein
MRRGEQGTKSLQKHYQNRERRQDAGATSQAQRGLAGFSGDPGAFFARFGKPDGNGLLAALYASTLATFAGSQGATLSSAHGAGNSLTCTFAVPAA